MLMMGRRRERIAGIRDNLISTALTFIDAGVGRHNPGRVGRIESRVGQIRQVMEVFVLRHSSCAVIGRILSTTA
jgi:hypothetical protein